MTKNHSELALEPNFDGTIHAVEQTMLHRVDLLKRARLFIIQQDWKRFIDPSLTSRLDLDPDFWQPFDVIAIDDGEMTVIVSEGIPKKKHDPDRPPQIGFERGRIFIIHYGPKHIKGMGQCGHVTDSCAEMIVSPSGFLLNSYAERHSGVWKKYIEHSRITEEMKKMADHEGAPSDIEKDPHKYFTRMEDGKWKFTGGDGDTKIFRNEKEIQNEILRLHAHANDIRVKAMKLKREIMIMTTINIALAVIERITEPSQFIVEEAPLSVPIEGPWVEGDYAAPAAARPRYRLLDLGATKRILRSNENLEPMGEAKHNTPHERRAHWKELRSERFRFKRGQRVLVRACWVGSTERIEGQTRYRVLLDAAGRAPSNRSTQKV